MVTGSYQQRRIAGFSLIIIGLVLIGLNVVLLSRGQGTFNSGLQLFVGLALLVFGILILLVAFIESWWRRGFTIFVDGLQAG